MEKNFSHLSESSKVWIYQSNRLLSNEEVIQAKEILAQFVSEWASHGEKVNDGGAVLYNLFIVLAADETNVSVGGCSIDSSVHCIREIEKACEISLFDRFNIAFKDDGEVKLANRSQFQQMLIEGKLDEESIVFNNLVSTKQEFTGEWEVPLKQSWHHKLFSIPA